MKTQDLNNTAEPFRPTEEQVLEFLHGIPLGTILTLSTEGKPQGATVAFSEHPGLALIIGTAKDSRKSQNLQRNPAVAYVATDPDTRCTVQWEGTARQLTDEEFDAYAEKHFAKLPQSAPFRNVVGQCYFLLSPTYVRFTDCTPYPWVKTEFNF